MNANSLVKNVLTYGERKSRQILAETQIRSMHQIPDRSSQCFQAFKTHSINVHGADDFCEERNCSFYKGHGTRGWFGVYAPHGENICRICDLVFKFQKHLDQHVATRHADHDMTNKQFYDLYLKYKGSYYKV